MGKLSDNKLAKLNALEPQGGFWYITKQNLIFRDLCFMAKILESWGDRKEESYQSFFDSHKEMKEFGSFSPLTAHRATKNCEYIGLTRPSNNYKAENLTPFYFALKDICDGDFNRLSSFPKIIDKQLERMFIDSNTSTVYNVKFQICPFMFLFKVLLLIGDITKSYKISKSEFKLFVATAQSWMEYFEVVESILRYREDTAYRAQCDINAARVSDVRYNILAENHSQITVEGSEISIPESEIRNVRRKVAEYELSESIQSAEDIFNTDIINKSSLLLQRIENQDYLPYLTALRTKPFMLLAGISGTGKSRIARQIAKACWKPGDADYGKNNPSNFCLVQVKPNWHDSTELLGYVSRISGTPKYVTGDFLPFIAKAWENLDIPHILCLDEMNLAPVEQYFAEYLSVIESRKLNEDGTITTDPIIKKNKEDWYRLLTAELTDDDKLRAQFLDKGITLPPNLFVIGTVNMDETTFSFSRKVLDRAMTIEMNEVDLEGGLTKEEQNELGEIGNSIIGLAVEGKDVYEEHKVYCDQVIDYLKKVNDELENTPFKIAYRTRNEFLLYAVNRKAFDKESSLETALDEMTSMKILPRIEGDSERVKTPLETLRKLMEERGWDENESISLKKIKEMLSKLQSGYTSYWT